MGPKATNPGTSGRKTVPFVRNLRTVRAATGVSQGALARATGLSERTIARLESGQHFPKPATLRKLATVLGVSPQQLQGVPGYPLPALAAMAPSPLPPEHHGAASGLMPAGVLAIMPVAGQVAAGAVSAPPPGPACRPTFWRCPTCANVYNREVQACPNDGGNRPA